MKNLIIIGNGFDKAHKLETSYNEFIKDLFIKYFSNPDDYPEIIKSFPTSIKNFRELLSSLQQYNRTSKDPIHYVDNNYFPLKFKNRFIELLLINMVDYNWCDVESMYFKELMRYNNYHHDPKKLNDDFDTVKEYLSKYLLDEEKKAVKIDSYEHFFKTVATHPYFTLVLNFNYTRTIENLYADVIECPIMHIHGEIKNPDNPIIFGYAANHEDSRKLLSHSNDEYIKNIKKYLYKRTDRESKLHEFLGELRENPRDDQKINIFLLGHSCGLSDSLILNEIFNHKTIDSIKIFYHEDFKNYFHVQANIDRIMNNDERFKNLIVNFQETHRMPQWDDDEPKIEDFKKTLIF
jgi:hypothetical protein